MRVMRFPSWAPLLGAAAIATGIILTAFFAPTVWAAAKPQLPFVVTEIIETPVSGRQKCFIWLGNEMSFSIRPFVSLGCYPMPAEDS